MRSTLRRRAALETTERLNFELRRALRRGAARRARCASGRRAWRRCGSGGWRRFARRGTARRRPRGSSCPRRRARRRAARPGSVLLRACARRPGRARRVPSRPARGADRLELLERGFDRLAGRTLLAVATPDGAEREQRPARPNGSPTASCSATACARSPSACSTSPRAAATSPRQRVACASTHSRATRSASASQASSSSPRRRCGRARAGARRDRPSTSGHSARPSPARRVAVGLVEPVGRADRSPSDSATSPMTARCCGGCEPELFLGQGEGTLRMLAGKLELAPMDGDDRDRQVVLRHLEAVLDRDVVVAAAACSAASCQRPAQNSTQARPHEGAGASRLVPLAPLPVLALEQRAGLAPASTRARACSRSPASPPEPAARRRRRSRTRACRATEIVRRPASPANQSSTACTARARARSASSSTWSASSSAERAWSDPALEASGPRKAAADADCSAGRELASRSASSSSSTERSVLSSSERRMSASARSEPISGLGQEVGRDRPGARPFAGALMRPRGGERAAWRSSRAPCGVSRRACSASSAATADAPRSTRQADGVVELGRDGGIRRLAARARGGARAGAGRRRAAAIARVDAPPLVAEVAVEHRRKQRMREANRRRRRARSRAQRPPARAHLRRHRPRASNESEVVPSAATSASASWVGRGKPAILARSSSSSVSGTGSGCERVDVRVEHAGQLQREEGVAARALVDAQQRLARERPAEPVEQESMKRAGAQRSHAKPPDASGASARSSSVGCADVPERVAGRAARARGSARVFAARRRARSPRTHRAIARRRRRGGSARARRAAAARRATRRRARDDRHVRPAPRLAATRPRARAASAASARAEPRRGRPRADRRARRARGRTRSPRDGTRAHAARCPAHARRRRARASTSRSRARPRARAPSAAAARRRRTPERAASSASRPTTSGVVVLAGCSALTLTRGVRAERLVHSDRGERRNAAVLSGW